MLSAHTHPRALPSATPSFRSIYNPHLCMSRNFPCYTYHLYHESSHKYERNTVNSVARHTFVQAGGTGWHDVSEGDQTEGDASWATLLLLTSLGAPCPYDECWGKLYMHDISTNRNYPCYIHHFCIVIGHECGRNTEISALCVHEEDGAWGRSRGVTRFCKSCRDHRR